jgi:hypothetical protein
MGENEAARIFIGALRNRIEDSRHFVIMIVGEPRSGKSYSALRIAELVDQDFSLGNLVYSPGEFLQLVKTREEGSAIVFDEAGVKIFSRDWQSKMNKALAKVFQILGYKHLGIILTFPSVMFVDKAVRRLFNYILLAKGFDRRHEISFCKAYYNLPTNYVLGTEILAPFSIAEDGQRIDASDLVFRKPKLAEEYEDYARQRKDELLHELEEDILELLDENGNENRDSWIKHDSVAKFISDCLEECENGKIPKGELYSLYLQFCEENRLAPLGIIEFGRKLRSIVPVGEKKTRDKRYWTGIAVRKDFYRRMLENRVFTPSHDCNTT